MTKWQGSGGSDWGGERYEKRVEAASRRLMMKQELQ
jgi:hypothetical protein